MTLPLLSVIVPTYNEREQLADFVATTFGVLDAARLDAEMVIVDDNSPDGTGAIADGLAERYRLRVVHRAGKLGLGSAVMAGCAEARGEWLAVMDADLSHPPDTLPLLVAALRHTDADMVIASRYVAGGGTENWPVSRALMSRTACVVARVLTPVRDAASGFFVMNRRVLRDVDVKATGFKICLELLVRSRCGHVVEVPYVFADRAAGRSKMNHREALGYFAQVLALYGWSRRHPRADGVRHVALSRAEAERLAAALADLNQPTT